MPAWSPKTRPRLFHAAVYVAVALVHALVFVLILPAAEPRTSLRPSPQPYFLAFTPPPPPRTTRAHSHRRRRKDETARAARPSQLALRASPSTAPDAVAGPAAAGPATGPPAINWSDGVVTLQQALRTSVGCDREDLKLTRAEHERCLEHAARQAKLGRKIGPAGDDPKRAAELAAEAEEAKRMGDYRSTYGEHGMAWDALPPKSLILKNPTDDGTYGPPPPR